MAPRRKGKAEENEDSDTEVVAASRDADEVCTQWDEPFDLSSLPVSVASKLQCMAPLLLGRKKAKYDAAFFYRTLGLCMSGTKFSELNSDKVCSKSLFIESWPLQSSGRHHIADCSDEQAITAYTEMHNLVYGGDPDNGTFGTSFLRACYLSFEMGKDVNWAQKAELLQKAREKGPSRNPLKLAPPALREQIEAIIDVLAGHIDDNAPAANTMEPSDICDAGNNTGLVTGSSSKGSMRVEVPRRRSRSSSRPAKDFENKKPGRSCPDGSKHEERPNSDPNAKLDQARMKRAEVEHGMLKMEATRERIESDLRNQRALLSEKEEEESRFYEEVSAARAASKKASAAGNEEEKKRYEGVARLRGDQMALAMAAARNAQERIDKKETQLKDMDSDILKRRDEVGILTLEIDALTQATAFIRPKKVFAHLPTEFRHLPIQVSDPCPFCDRYFVDTACVPLTCGCLAHPHCMFQAVFLLDAKCTRCQRAGSGGWLGQWGFSLHERAQAELHLLEEILQQESEAPRVQQTSGTPKRAAERIPLQPGDEERQTKKAHIKDPEEMSKALVVYTPGTTVDAANTKVQKARNAGMLPLAARAVKDVATTSVKDFTKFVWKTHVSPNVKAAGTSGVGGDPNSEVHPQETEGNADDKNNLEGLDSLIDAIAVEADV